MEKRVVGIIRVPVYGILGLSDEWRKSVLLPVPSRSDWKAVASLRNSVFSSCIHPTSSDSDIIVNTSRCYKMARGMSFYGFLKDRMIDDARKYSEHGVTAFLLDFDCTEEPAFYWLAKCLSDDFRNASEGNFVIGMRMSNASWCAGISCHAGFQFMVHDGVAMERNRITDGTGIAKPVIFSTCGDFPEGMYYDGDNLDGIERVVSTACDFRNSYGIDVPVMAWYHEEMERDGMYYDTESWLGIDYMLIDARKESLYPVDEGMLDGLCESISRLKI